MSRYTVLVPMRRITVSKRHAIGILRLKTLIGDTLQRIMVTVHSVLTCVTKNNLARQLNVDLTPAVGGNMTNVLHLTAVRKFNFPSKTITLASRQVLLQVSFFLHCMLGSYQP